MPLLIGLGLVGHIVGLIRDVGVPLPARLPEPMRMLAAAIAVALVVIFSPGVAKTFIYVQF